MKPPRRMVAGVILTLVVLLAGFSVYAQMRPYHNGSAWSIAFIRMKPGMESAYLSYLAGDWKREQEALKSAGIVVSYKVLSTEGHSASDWNLLLMTEYKDLASMEANEQKAEAISLKLVGGDEKGRQGYKDRAEIREIMGDRLAREVVLSAQ